MSTSNSQFPIGETLALPDDVVQLWCVELGVLPVSEQSWLDILRPNEQARAQRFISAQARQHFLVTRGLLRNILAAYLLVAPKEVAFQESAMGKLSLAAPHANTGIKFNVSHSGGLGLLAFSRKREVGVDIELIHADVKIDAIGRRFFSVEEQRQLALGSLEVKTESFFRCWTRKEAFIKAKGEGLSHPLDQFDVSLAPTDTECLLATRPDSSEAYMWSVRDVPVPSGYVAAVCAAGRDWQLAISSKHIPLALLSRGSAVGPPSQI